MPVIPLVENLVENLVSKTIEQSLGRSFRQRGDRKMSKLL
jgi:hypothetical protein